MKWGSRFLLGVGMIGSFLACSIHSNAAPADTEIGSYQQPTGQQFEAQIIGDEYLSYTLANETGDLIELSKDGYWYYSLFDDETKQTIASKNKYLIDDRPSSALSSKDIGKLKPKRSEEVAVRSLKSVPKWNKEQSLLVVLVEFSDVKLNYSDADWEKRVFSQTEKSLSSYYKEATKEMIDLKPVKKKDGKQDGIVRIQLEREHPKAGNQFDLARPALKEALEKLQDYVDITEYDQNKNGIIEQNEMHIMAIFAGYEASSIKMTDSVWGHKGSFQGRPIGYPVVDGIKLNNYTLFGETMVKKNSDPTKQYEYQSELGLVAHEFGHDLKLPDLYNSERMIIEHEGKYVEVSNGDGLGKYSLMAGGSWTYLEGEEAGATPTHLDAYSKVMLGVVEPQVVNKEQTVSVNHISSPDFNVYRINTANPQEYFLIENRQLVGFDASLKSTIYSEEHGTKPIVASGGIGVYHINEAFSTNTSPTSQLVTMKEADEGILGYSKLKEPRYYATNNYDGFYYIGQGGHDKPQQNTLYKTTVPSTKTTSGDYAKYNMIVESKSSLNMRVSFVDDPVSVTGVTIDPVDKVLVVGESQPLKAQVVPANATNKKVMWRSSDEKIAVVDENGIVTAKAKGSVTINVETEDGSKKADCTIDVTIEKKLSEWFEDQNLATMIGYNLDLILTDKVTEKRLSQVKKLDLRSERAISAISDSASRYDNLLYFPMGYGKDIQNLKGFEVFNDLEELIIPYYFSYEAIENINLIEQLHKINTIGVNEVSSALSKVNFDLAKITTLYVESLGESDISYLEKMTNLKSINYYASDGRDHSGYGWIDTPVVTALAKNKNLEKIDSFYFSETKALQLVQTIPNLKELVVSGVEFNEENLNYLQQLSKIEKLSVKEISLDKTDSLDSFKNMKNLYALSFDSSNMKIDFSVLSELDNLKELSIAAADAQWETLSKLPGLTKLTIENSGSNINSLTFLQTMGNLEKLVIDRVDDVDNYSEVGELKKLKQLSLKIDSSEYKSDLSALGKLKQLKELDLHGIYFYDEERPQDSSFLRSLTELERLNLEFTGFNDIDTLRLMKNLKYFNYGYCILEEEQVLDLFADSRGVYLRPGYSSSLENEYPNIYFLH
ncbi:MULTISPECIES: M6 family metalloprotease domain-containing protein [unclassified Enterococcus]|uniref:M6 family metalloprotease domain-containing protein n=1 Tax=unclassified Enterococcus TaxID=2608891 RepID=UPI001CE1804E|nr:MULTISPECIES: M6 family metalloprotease domain-containing protein [unclassified Enterococcus]MCA5013366.1 M6 family metalloprotease domain-containing protein [Enterococcus sp. S23]MCA5016616.1 M6 family metalloprotease domain-containing protein [Enterococcus sp. S22(2020)]